MENLYENFYFYSNFILNDDRFRPINNEISSDIQGIIFGDNLAIPAIDKYGSQPTIELLRQWIDHNYWADLSNCSKLELVDLVRHL